MHKFNVYYNAIVFMTFPTLRFSSGLVEMFCNKGKVQENFIHDRFPVADNMQGNLVCTAMQVFMVFSHLG